jgi:hypothetical protein
VASPVPAVPQEELDDVTQAYMNDVLEVAEMAAFMAEATCEELAILVRDNPREVSSLRGFAAVLKRMPEQEPALDRPEVRALLDDLDRALAQMNGALSLCGLNPS